MNAVPTSKVGKASRINLFSLAKPHMRTFHVTWFAFFLCFFGWFGVAPLMPVIREELALTKSQIGSIVISSVAITIFARLLIGWLCDKIGPRITYTYILFLGSLPVMFIGLSNSYESFLLFRLAIGVIGASFVVTQYHTSMMFAPNVVGTANATTAGWGNMGGGVTQIIMPLIFAGFVGLGFVESSAWRYALVVPGLMLFLMGIVYYKCTQDTPEGNVANLKKSDPEYRMKAAEAKGAFWKACKDIRVWMLFFSLFVKMSEGATYSVVPFINKKAIGSVSGIVGAGGNVGAVLAGFLLKEDALTYSDALFIIGCVVIAVSFTSFLVKFSKVHEAEAQSEMDASLGVKPFTEKQLQPAKAEI
ncbi:MAG: MFS transporter [Bacteroidota bacterium]|nr:MFS transporter [Bacteroidota bacterium]